MSNLYRYRKNNMITKTSINKDKKNKFSAYTKNTFKSLKDVEYFLRNFQTFSKSIKLYKILKK